MARTSYSPQTKAAVMAALLEGQGTSKVAADFKLPEGTVKAWRNRLQGGASEMQQVATEKREAIGTLLLEYLHENLVTLKAQNIVFRDAVWLKQQNAADVAVLHGVLTDKAIRLLESLGGVPDEPTPPNAAPADTATG